MDGLIDWRWSVLMVSHASSLWFCYAKSLSCSDKITENHSALKTILTTWMIKGIVNTYAVSNPYYFFCGAQQVHFMKNIIATIVLYYKGMIQYCMLQQSLRIYGTVFFRFKVLLLHYIQYYISRQLYIK